MWIFFSEGATFEMYRIIFFRKVKKMWGVYDYHQSFRSLAVNIILLYEVNIAGQYKMH